MRARRLVAALLAACAAACGGGGGAQPPTSPSSPSAPAATYASAHFVFHHTALDAANIAVIAAGVEAAYARVLADLGVGAMPAVDVTFYPDHAALAAGVRPLVGVIPAFATGLVTSSTQIHMISPNAPGVGPFEYMITTLVHEFAHCVSLRIDSAFANNPRWLWEAVALYEAGQRVDLATIPYMAALTPPSLEALASLNDTRVYDVGYSLVEFIVERFGAPAVPALIASHGNTPAVLGLALPDFEREWLAFARQRYGLGGGGAAAGTLSVLFIGNSLTYTNDLPALVESLGRAAGADIRCTSVTRPGFSLEDHWNEGEARRAIARGGWSHVVLQQGPSALPESRVLLNEYARRFDGEIRRAGARPVLFMVWPSSDRSRDFDAVSASYAGAAALIGGDLFAAGDAWRAAWRRKSSLALYGPDGFHPSPLGSTLAALVAVNQLVARLPPASAVDDVPAADAALLLESAAEVQRPAIAPH